MPDDGSRVELLPGRSSASWDALSTGLILATVASMILVVAAAWAPPSWLWVPLSWLVLFALAALTVWCSRLADARTLAEAAHGYTTNQDDFNHDYVDRRTGRVLRRAGILTAGSLEASLQPVADGEPSRGNGAYRAGYLATVLPFGLTALLLAAVVVYLVASGDAMRYVGIFLVFLAAALAAIVGVVVMLTGQLRVRRFLSSDAATRSGVFAFTSDIEPSTYTAGLLLGVTLKARQIGTVLSADGIAIYPGSDPLPAIHVPWREVTRVQAIAETGTKEKYSWLYIGFEHPDFGELFLAWGSLQFAPWTLQTRAITQRIAARAESLLEASAANPAAASGS